MYWANWLPRRRRMAGRLVAAQGSGNEAATGLLLAAAIRQSLIRSSQVSDESLPWSQSSPLPRVQRELRNATGAGGGDVAVEQNRIGHETEIKCLTGTLSFARLEFEMRDDAPRDLAHGLIFMGPPAPDVLASRLGRSGALAGRMRSLPTISLAPPTSRVEEGGSRLPDQAMGLAPRRTSVPSRTMSRRMRVEAARRQV